MAKIRTVVVNPQFDEERARIEPSISRFDDLTFGLEWLLARDPELVGERGSPTGSVWFTHAGGVPGFPDLYIYYTFDDTHVYLLSVQLATSGN
jgi:hypothetical protein